MAKIKKTSIINCWCEYSYLPTHPQTLTRICYKYELVQAHCKTIYLPLLKLNISTPSVQLSSVTQSCLTLCDPMNRSTPGLPVHLQLPEFTQTHIHRVSDAIRPSHPLLSPSPLAPNPSQHQSLFQ